MNITDTVANARETAMHRLSEAKMDKTAKENDELKAENRLLRDELAETRSERKQVLDLLDKAQISMSGSSKRRFRILRIVAVGGAVYAVATQTGVKQRAKEWIDEMRGKGQEFGSDVAAKGSEMTHQVGDAIEHTGRKLEETGESIEQSARKTAK